MGAGTQRPGGALRTTVDASTAPPALTTAATPKAVVQPAVCSSAANGTIHHGARIGRSGASFGRIGPEQGDKAELADRCLHVHFEIVQAARRVEEADECFGRPPFERSQRRLALTSDRPAEPPGIARHRRDRFPHGREVAQPGTSSHGGVRRTGIRSPVHRV